MPGFAQQVHDTSYVLFLHQNVIRVIGGDGEDRHAMVRKRLDEREQDSGLREGEWAFELRQIQRCGE